LLFFPKRRGETTPTGLNYFVVDYQLRASLAGLRLWLKRLRL